MLGTDQNVYVHTFVKMNFDKVKTQENLVQPTDEDNNGIIISSEENSKSYSGTGEIKAELLGQAKLMFLVMLVVIRMEIAITKKNRDE